MKPTIYYWIGSIANSAQPIILLPISSYMLSEIELSIWLMFSVISSFILVTEGGLTIAIVRAASYYMAGRSSLTYTPISQDHTLGRRNDRRLVELKKESAILYLILGILVLAIVGTFGAFTIANLISASLTPQKNWLAFIFAILSMAVQIQSMRCSALLQGIGRLEVAKKIQAIFSIIRLAFGFFSIKQGYGLLGFTLLQLLACLIEFVFLSVSTTQSYSIFSDFDKSRKNSSSIIREIWAPVWKISIVRFSGFFIFYGSSLVVAQLNNPQLISSFLISQRLILLCTSFSIVPLLVQLPVINTLIAKHNHGTLHKLAINSMAVCLLLYALASILVIFLGPRILEVISNNFMLLDKPLLAFMALIYFLELHHTMHATIYEASNDHPFIFLSLISSTLLLLGYISVYRTWEISGILAIHFLVQAAGNNWIPVKYSINLMGLSFQRYVKNLLHSIKTILKRN